MLLLAANPKGITANAAFLLKLESVPKSSLRDDVPFDKVSVEKASKNFITFII